MATLFRLKLTCEEGTKPVPVKVRENAGPPAVALAGDRLPTVGSVLFGKIVSVTGAEVPPPATPFGGFVTAIAAAPGLVTSVASIAAVSSVGLTYVVERADPLRFTIELVTKFEPFNESVNAVAATTTLVGLIDEMVGNGLKTVNSMDVEAPPPGSGLNT